LQAAHDATHADTTMLFVRYPPTDYLGLTLGALGGGPPPPTSALSVINIAGNLGHYVYQHEWGHQLGAQHQLSGGILGDTIGSPNYAHGFYVRWKQQFPIVGTVQYCGNTIMTYQAKPNLSGVDCSTSIGYGDNHTILYFSNPNVSAYVATVTYVDYYAATGDFGSANNAGMLAASAETVAKNHATKWFTGPAFVGIIFNFILLTEP